MQDNIIMSNVCSECQKFYKSKQSLWNHQNKFHNAIKIRKQIIKLQKQNKDLEEILKNTNTIINNNIINNNQVINNNLVLKFGTEDIDKLSCEEVKLILNSGPSGLNKLVEIVHCNSKYPEYNNIKITNLKDKYCKIHDGTEFISQSKKDLMKELIVARNADLSGLHEQFRADTTKKQENIKNLIAKIDQCLFENDDESDKELTKYYKSICEEITLILYNKGKISESI
jgi:hypothetical protein